MEKKTLITFCVVILILFGLTGVGIGVGFGIFSSSQSSQNPWNDSDFRLPQSILPFHYKLKVWPILENVEEHAQFSAPGTAQIFVECVESTKAIVFHASNDMVINLSTVKVTPSDSGIPVGIAGFDYSPSVDFFTIFLTNELVVGRIYEILIEYVAFIPENRLNGMYLDYYEDPTTGERNNVATTLFAPYHARKAFPCFDEPNFRATFDIVIGRHANYHAMSNGILLNTTPMPGVPDWYWDTFETTPSISPYIIAMIVSNFAYEEAEGGIFRNVSVRTYAPPHHIERGGATYAVNLAANLLAYFESFFYVEYPLPKAYSVALPHFFFNAMENWGLITYKEPVILYFPNETSEAERYKINYVTSHELAHQWFGNLVNCKWWAYVWLKEGFATFYAHYGINHTNPELEPWTQFPTTVLQVAMDFDTSNKTHPLENFPKTSSSVADIYTRIPYEKGASILRMTSKFLTEPIFHEGIRKYVQLFQYKGAEQNDLFQVLQNSLPPNLIPTQLKRILDTWTTQSGFPLLRVSASGPDYVSITQEKYIGEDESNPDHTWWVPVTIWPKTNPELEQDFTDNWIPQGVGQILVKINSSQPILVNPRSIGYYRVLYDDLMLDKIHERLMVKHTDLPASGKSQIMSDYFDFARFDYIGIETVLNLTTYMDKETEFVVWKSVVRNLKKMYNLIVGTKYFDEFKIYWTRKIEHAMTLLHGWPNFEGKNWDYELPDMVEILFLEWLSMLESSEMASRSQQIMDKWTKARRTKKNLILADFQIPVYCSAIMTDELFWEFLYKQFRMEKSTVLKTRFVDGLACTKNSKLISRLLSMTHSANQEMKFEDKELILNGCSGSAHAYGATFEFIQQNYKDLTASLKSPKPVTDALEKISEFMKTDAELQQLQNLSQTMTNGTTTLDNAVRTVRKNIEWMEKHAESANSWFKAQNKMSSK